MDQTQTDIAGWIAKEFGLEGLPQEKLEALAVSMGEALMKRIFLETLDRLGEAGAEEYEQLLETNPEQQAVERFLAERIPGYTELVAAIVEDFKAEMKAAIIAQQPAAGEVAASLEETSQKAAVQDDAITMLN